MSVKNVKNETDNKNFTDIILKDNILSDIWSISIGFTEKPSKHILNS